MNTCRLLTTSLLAIVITVVAALRLPAQDAVEVGAATYERKASAVFFYQRTAETFDVFGQCEVTYGAPQWHDDYPQQLAAAPKGQRLRLGRDGWTVLDTNVALRVGDVTIPAGVYYLAVETCGEGALNLLMLDAAVVRKRKLFASMTATTEGGVAVPLRVVPEDDDAPREKVERLAMRWQRVAAGGNDVELVLRWGKLEFRAALSPVLDGTKAG